MWRSGSFFTSPASGGAGRACLRAHGQRDGGARPRRSRCWPGNAGGPNAALLAEKVRLIDLGLPLRGEGYGKPTTLRGLLQTARPLRRLAPDAVFSAPEFVNLLAALALVVARSRARFFPTFHAATSLVAGRLGARIAVWLSLLVATRATKAVAVSAGVGRELEARGFPASKIAVIHNPLPQEAPRQRRDPACAEIWRRWVTDRRRHRGRLVPVKDHRTLLRAFALLQASRPARLVIFGEGPLEGELHACAQEMGIGDRVLFAGYTDDLHAGYAVADLFALSSTSEGFGNVLVEAMAAGVPVVSCDAPHGPREILDDGRYGKLVPVGDAPALAAAMAEMLDCPTPVAVLKRRAADFDVSRIGDHYEALL